MYYANYLNLRKFDPKESSPAFKYFRKKYDEAVNLSEK